MAKTNLITQKAYAAKKGVTPQYVNKLVKQGKIRVVGKKVDPKQADAAIAAFRRAGRVVPAKKRAKAKKAPAKRASRARHREIPTHDAPEMIPEPSLPGSHRGDATSSLTANRATREYYEAQRARLDYEKSVGKLLPADQVLEAERKKNTTLRMLLASLPRALAPTLATTIEAAECEEILTRALDQVREEFAADPLGLKAEPAATVEVASEAVPAVEIPPASPMAEGASA